MSAQTVIGASAEVAAATVAGTHAVIGMKKTIVVALVVTTTAEVDDTAPDPGPHVMIVIIDLAGSDLGWKRIMAATVIGAQFETDANELQVRRPNLQPLSPRRMSVTGGLSSFSSLQQDLERKS